MASAVQNDHRQFGERRGFRRRLKGVAGGIEDRCVHSPSRIVGESIAMMVKWLLPWVRRAGVLSS